MTDRELLEMAAKAAGILTQSWYGNEAYFDGVLSRWNPLTDDGDALRLAVDLGIDIVRCHTGWIIASEGVNAYVESLREDKYAATRRAIVRAAAAIGEAMQ